VLWAEVRSRAYELYDRNVMPGLDYALTEVVHCKSKGNKGVESALDECADLYLTRVLSCSGSRILVILGEMPKQIVTKKYNLPAHPPVQGPVDVAGRERFVVFLGAPNSNRLRKFTSDELAPFLPRLRAILRGATAPRQPNRKSSASVTTEGEVLVWIATLNPSIPT